MTHILSQARWGINPIDLLCRPAWLSETPGEGWCHMEDGVRGARNTGAIHFETRIN